MSGDGRRTSRSASSHSQGMSAQVLVVGHDSQATIQRLKPYTSPVSRAPPGRIPSARPSP